MTIEHTRRAEWLRSVQAARPPSVQVVGQVLEDNLRATVAAHDVTHLEDPTRWIEAAAWRSEVAGAQPERLEIRAVRPFWLERLRTIIPAGGVLELVDAHVLATADQVPETFGQEATTLRFRVGKAAGAAGEGYLLPTADTIQTFPGRGLYVPERRILSVTAAGAGGGMTVSFLVREVPNPATVP